MISCLCNGGHTLSKNIEKLDQVNNGATAVITHRIRAGRESQYEDWLNEIGPLCRSSAGHLDWHIIRPILGLTATYTVIIRFDTRNHLQDWMDSDHRKRLIEKVKPILAKDDDFFIKSGLDFWFTPDGARAKVPVRWKQAIVTWSAIYPLVLVVPLLVVPLLRFLGLSQDRYLDTLFISGTVVILMVYMIMPRYTKLVHRWLFN
ncbi:antibiotic biosynthesis monooxygenase [Desulfopila sp. IMCC35006]|uniref:antibiotic biosynthesis monooxygenase n=1 Tax=Desulfopila sp. IMCC35006 TaxID=2569542 RepID=UPI0010AD423C|nr:antibiotic biosynthesis monooxygenase [Desulfopila sp. IMCC35006]TKB25574.1 antibiotic biosynthesis monooxygenase [Desulfopila sp. IMCC35006]